MAKVVHANTRMDSLSMSRESLCLMHDSASIQPCHVDLQLSWHTFSIRETNEELTNLAVRLTQGMPRQLAIEQVHVLNERAERGAHASCYLIEAK